MFLALQPAVISPEILAWTQSKLSSLYEGKLPEYYQRDKPYDFELSKQQMLKLLDFIIVDTKRAYPLFNLYMQQINQLKENSSAIDKEASFHWAKKTLEAQCWFVCHQPIQAAILDRYTVNLCATGAASNLDMALRHFSTTDFEAALHAGKESLIRMLVQAYVNEHKLCPHEGNEVHYVNAYFNYLASSYGCKEQFDAFAVPNPELNTLNGLTAYVNKYFTLDAFLDRLHAILPPLPQETFDASNNTLYRSLRDYAVFINTEENKADLEDQIYQLYDYEEIENLGNGNSQIKAKMIPKNNFHAILNALLISQLSQRKLIDEAYLRLDESSYLLSGKFFLKKVQTSLDKYFYSILSVKEQARLQVQVSLYLQDEGNEIKDCCFDKALLWKVLDETQLIALYKKADETKNFPLLEEAFLQIMQQQSCFHLFFQEIMRHKNTQNHQHFISFANDVLSHPSVLVKEELVLLSSYLKEQQPHQLRACIIEACKNNAALALLVMLNTLKATFCVNQAIDNHGNTLLGLAAKKGHITSIKILLGQGARIDQSNFEDISPLWIAIFYHRTEVIKLLLERKANPNKAKYNGVTPLWIAAQSGYVEAIKILLENGAKINQEENNMGLTPLCIAAQNGHVEALKILLNNGAILNNPRNKSMTALWAAAVYGHIEIVKLLIDMNADLNQRNTQGLTALWVAAQNGHIALVHLLLNAGAKVDIPKRNGVTPLWVATQNGHLPVIKALIEKKADLNQANEAGITPLFIATYYAHNEAIAYLLSEGAKSNQPEKTGISPLWIAASQGNISALKLLLSKGADFSQADQKGISPLWVAAQNGQLLAVKLLIEKGAAVNQCENSKGVSPLFVAAQNGHIEVVKFLIEKGACLNQPNKKGTTPLWIAAYNGYVEVIKCLIERGAALNQAGKKGATPLFVAAQHGRALPVKVLLAAGASPSYSFLDTAENLLKFSEQYSLSVQARMRAWILMQNQAPRRQLYVKPHEIADILGYKRLATIIKSYLPTFSEHSALRLCHKSF